MWRSEGSILSWFLRGPHCLDLYRGAFYSYRSIYTNKPAGHDVLLRRRPKSESQSSPAQPTKVAASEGIHVRTCRNGETSRYHCTDCYDNRLTGKKCCHQRHSWSSYSMTIMTEFRRTSSTRPSSKRKRRLATNTGSSRPFRATTAAAATAVARRSNDSATKTPTRRSKRKRNTSGSLS